MMETQAHTWDTACRVAHASNPGLQFMGQQWNQTRHLTDWIKQTAPAGGRALEIGVGGGRALLETVDHFREVVAVDVSAEMLDSCRRAHGDFGGRVEYRLVDGVDLGRAGGGFDVAYAVSVFVHLEYWQVFALLRQLPALLEPGGAVVFNFITPVVAGLLEQQADYLLQHGDMPWTHYRLITRDMLQVLVQRAGFDPATFETLGDFARARTPGA